MQIIVHLQYWPYLTLCMWSVDLYAYVIYSAYTKCVYSAPKQESKTFEIFQIT